MRPRPTRWPVQSLVFLCNNAHPTNQIDRTHPRRLIEGWYRLLVTGCKRWLMSLKRSSHSASLARRMQSPSGGSVGAISMQETPRGTVVWMHRIRHEAKTQPRGAQRQRDLGSPRRGNGRFQPLCAIRVVSPTLHWIRRAVAGRVRLAGSG